MKPSTHKQSGLTLIELLIALVLGLFVSAVIITVFATNVRSSSQNIQMVRLNQELRGVMTMMVDELRRAGHSTDTNNANFMLDFDTSAGCIRYSYNDPANGNDTRDSNERFGFKLEANRVRWTNSGGNPTPSGTKGSADCTSGVWTSLTTVDIASITTLDFDISGSTVKDNSVVETGIVALTTTTGISFYDVTITLTGVADLPHTSDANDPRRTLIETVRVRNDAPNE